MCCVSVESVDPPGCSLEPFLITTIIDSIALVALHDEMSL